MRRAPRVIASRKQRLRKAASVSPVRWDSIRQELETSFFMKLLKKTNR